MNIVRFIPRHTMDDLRIYCQNEEDQLNVVSFLEENFPDIKICTWDPDPVDTDLECSLMSLNLIYG